MIVRPAQPIAGNNKPLTDRRAVFVTLDNESGTIDLLIPQRNERFGQLRCIYIDTSAQDSSGNGCVIETDIGQNITALPNTQGYYPVFVPFVTKLKISSNQTVNALLLDFDMRPAIWPTTATSSIVPNPLHVIIDGQPIAVDSTVQNFPTNYPVSQNSAWSVAQSGAWSVTVNNFPVTQSVSIAGQPITVNSTIQNWPSNNIGQRTTIGPAGGSFTGLAHMDALMISFDALTLTSRQAISISGVTFILPIVSNMTAMWLSLSNLKFSGPATVTSSAWNSGASGVLEILQLGY